MSRDVGRCIGVLHGTSPNKFFDYIATGLPVLNDYPGLLADLIAEHRCGLPVPPNEPEAFADAFCRLADDSAWRNTLSLNARRRSETQFSHERLAAQSAICLELIHSAVVIRSHGGKRALTIFRSLACRNHGSPKEWLGRNTSRMDDKITAVIVTALAQTDTLSGANGRDHVTRVTIGGIST